MRLERLAACLFGISALVAVPLAVAGPMYLTSEPGTGSTPDLTVDSSPPIQGESFVSRPANAIQVNEDVADPVPEPGSLLLLGAGVAAAALRRRTKRVG